MCHVHHLELKTKLERISQLGKNAQLPCTKYIGHSIVRGLGGRGGSFWVHRGEH